MTNEEKQLLLKDICARLPYDAIIKNKYSHIRYNFDSLVKDKDGEYLIDGVARLDEIEIYLRPMSSMTEKEQKEFDEFICIDEDAWRGNGIQGFINQAEIMSDGIDYLLAHHFDFRGLIEKGLALEASEDMYKTE